MAPVELTRMSIEIVDTLVDAERNRAEAKLKISFYINDGKGGYKLKGTVDSGWMNIGAGLTIPFDDTDYDENQLAQFGIYPRDVKYVEE